MKNMIQNIEKHNFLKSGGVLKNMCVNERLKVGKEMGNKKTDFMGFGEYIGWVLGRQSGKCPK